MIRNLIYFVAPFTHKKGAEWKLNIHHLNEFIGIFNGKKIVTIVKGPGLEDPEVVMKAFYDRSSIEFIITENHKRLGEVPHFLPMMAKVESYGTDEATFYAHAKGVRYKLGPEANRMRNVRKWRNRMYAVLLGSAETIDKAFADGYDAIGCFKKYDVRVGSRRGPIRQTKTGLKVAFSYSGTFFWFRHSAIFRQDHEQMNSENRCGVESYLGDKMPVEKALCLYADNLTAARRDNVYSWRATRWRKLDRDSAHLTKRPGPTKRHEIINTLARKIDATCYLELGVRRTEDNYDRINIKYKTGVDIIPLRKKILKLPTDEFFIQYSDHRYDIIFIDADHRYAGVKLDLEGALRLLKPGGYIVMHDCFPKTAMQASPNPLRFGRGAWCGQAYQVVANALLNDAIRGFVVDCDFGVGVFHKGDPEAVVGDGRLSFKELQDTPEFVNLIPPAKFHDMLEELG